MWATAKGDLDVFTDVDGQLERDQYYGVYQLASEFTISDNSAVVGLRAVSNGEGKLTAEIGDDIVTDASWR